MFRKIADTVSKMKTIHQVMLPVVTGILIIILAIGIAGAGPVGRQIGEVLLPLGLFVLGFMGLPMIVRKEIPWLVTIRGWVAVVEGIILLIIAWGLAGGFATLMLNSR